MVAMELQCVLNADSTILLFKKQLSYQGQFSYTDRGKFLIHNWVLCTQKMSDADNKVH